MPGTFLTTADFVEENIEFELNFVVGNFFKFGRFTKDFPDNCDGDDNPFLVPLETFLYEFYIFN